MKLRINNLLTLVFMIVALIGLAACGDSKAPTLTGNNTITYTIGDVVPRLDTLYSASDDTDGDLTSMVVIDSEDVDFTKPGTYTFTVSVKDSSGNETIKTVTVTVNNEKVAPVLNGLKNLVIEQGKTDVEYLEGVTATDNVDGDLTSKIVVDDSAVNYNVIGIYRVKYTVTDAAGNEATNHINVTVTYETEAPVLSGVSDLEIGLNESIPDFLIGVTATDNFDGDITTGIKVKFAAIDTSILGSHQITYEVRDASGNLTTQTVTLRVVDNVAPVIAGYRNLTFRVFDTPSFLWRNITVNDNVDGDLLSEIEIDASLVDMDVLGTYDLTYSVTDTAGNTATVIVTVTVKDFSAPEFTLIQTIYYLEGDDEPEYTDYVTAVDNYDGDLTDAISFDDSAVDLNTVGSYNIMMTVFDSSGNKETKVLVLVVPDPANVSVVNEDIASFDFGQTPINSTLPISELGTNGSSITWESLEKGFLTNDGRPIAPGIGEPAVEVVIVGTFTYEDYVKVVEFNVFVAPLSEIDLDLATKTTYDYIALGKEYVTENTTLDAYFTTTGNVPYVDIESILAAADGAIDFAELRFDFVDPILTISYDVEYEDIQGNMVMETLEAQFNFTENTVTTASMDFFNYYVQSTTTNYSDGLVYTGADFVEPTEVVFDLGFYGFDLVILDDNGEMKYLAPFNILNLLFFGDFYFDMYFNGDVFYGMDSGQLFNSSSSSVVTARVSSYNSKTMPRDLKLAAYHFMAFAMDHYYGIKKFANVNTYYDQLEEYIDEMLFSSDLDFYRAIFEFMYGLNDLHSSHSFTGYYEPSSYGYQLSLGDLGERVANYYQRSWAIEDLYEEKYGSTIPKTYALPDGKTVMIYFDGFNVDTPDEFKAELDALSPEIENVIIDLGNNGGGNLGAVLRMFGYMTEESFNYHSQNPLDGSAVTYYIESEYNAYDYNWFILTSSTTFSAANLYANIAKELGIPVIGLDSSGGASSIGVILPFGGSAVIISTNNVLSTRVFNQDTQQYEYLSIEYGIKVDYKLTNLLNDDEIMEAVETILSQGE